MDEKIQIARNELDIEFEQLEDKAAINRSKVFKNLYGELGRLPADDRAEAGQKINQLKKEFQDKVNQLEGKNQSLMSKIDLTAPFDVNVKPEFRPALLLTKQGSKHPLMQEMERVIDIFVRMGFAVHDSRQLDNDFNMFTALNFPEDHPARDDYDTFMTDEGLIPPAHTSTMQHRIIKNSQPPIRAIIPGRTFRNEDVDATHEHTFYQVEGVYVDKNITLADMLGTIKAFLEEYFEQEIEYRTQPFYFPFVEPGLEYLIKMPDSLKKPGQTEDKWLEVMGCGMTHPSVLEMAGVDPKVYSGFAWGFGLDRLVMLKYGIEDVRLFHSGKLDFLRSF
jgi:phenylalanyl-tRNA synthetase alpha chain